MGRGFSLIELLVVMGIISVLTAMATPVMLNALVRANVSALATEARVIHSAIKRHHMDFGYYPNSSDDPAFELDTFEPLVSMQYYDGHALAKLANYQVDAYDSPDDRGVNQEYWLEMTLRVDPSIRFLVADSDDAPLGGGVYYDGIYLFRNGVLTPLTSPVD